jgi:hypothetical protein
MIVHPVFYWLAFQLPFLQPFFIIIIKRIQRTVNRCRHRPAAFPNFLGYPNKNEYYKNYFIELNR